MPFTPGETLTLSSGASGDARRVHFVASNARNRLAIADGFAEFHPDNRAGAGAN